MSPLSKTILVLLLSVTLFSCDENSIEKTEEIETTNCDYSTIPDDKQVEIEILEKINNYRLSKNLYALKKLNIIKSQTYKHTLYMIEKNKTSHDNFSERSDFLNHKIKIKKIGENVARGYTNLDSLVQAWVDSPLHRHTIEDNYTHFDITAEQNQYGVWFYSNLFIRKTTD